MNFFSCFVTIRYKGGEGKERVYSHLAILGKSERGRRDREKIGLIEHRIGKEREWSLVFTLLLNLVFSFSSKSLSCWRD